MCLGMCSLCDNHVFDMWSPYDNHVWHVVSCDYYVRHVLCLACGYNVIVICDYHVVSVLLFAVICGKTSLVNITLGCTK